MGRRMTRATGDGRQGLGLLAVSLGHQRGGADGRRQGSSTERRASCYRRTRARQLAAIWVGGRARPAPVVLDTGLLCAIGGACECGTGEEIGREEKPEVCGGWGAPASGSGGGSVGERSRADVLGVDEDCEKGAALSWVRDFRFLFFVGFYFLDSPCVEKQAIRGIRL
jgi:hypothetical protein